MRRKVFSKPQQTPTFKNGNKIVLRLSDFDEYKEELVRLRNSGQLTVGKFRNRSTAINIFIEYMDKVNSINLEADEITITARNVYNAFNLFIKERRPAVHTLRTYLYSIRKVLEHILLSKYDTFLSQTIGIEVFDVEFYLSQLSKSTLQRKARQLKEYQEHEKEKVITDQRIKDGLKWLWILLNTKRTRTIENLRLATLVAIFTGARGSEINDLQFQVEVDGELLSQIDTKRGIIYLHRKKLKGDATKSFTPIFVHPIITEELKIFKKLYIIDSTESIFGYYSIDKIFQKYYTPQRAFTSQKTLERLYENNAWLKKYPPNRPILSLRAIRKYVDSYLQARMFELADRGIGASLFGKGFVGLDNMRRYKNYYLGRAEGVDFLHYISITEDPRYFMRYKKFTKRIFDGLVDKLMPELAYVVHRETLLKVYSSKGREKNIPNKKKKAFVE